MRVGSVCRIYAPCESFRLGRVYESRRRRFGLVIAAYESPRYGRIYVACESARFGRVYAACESPWFGLVYVACDWPLFGRVYAACESIVASVWSRLCDV